MSWELSLGNDPFSENPCDGDGWQVYSFNTNHASFKHPHELGIHYKLGVTTIRNVGLSRQLDRGTAFLLSYSEHGYCEWSVRGYGGSTCSWDSVGLAGLMRWEWPLQELGSKTTVERCLDAQRFLQEYTAWCNGWVYFIHLSRDGERIDSCGNVYGEENASHLACDILEHHQVRGLSLAGDAAGLMGYWDLEKYLEPEAPVAPPPLLVPRRDIVRKRK